MYNLNPGHAPTAVSAGSNAGRGPIDVVTLLNRTNNAFSPVRVSGATYMVFLRYIIDFPSITTMRVRDHFTTTSTWESQFLINRANSDYGHGFVVVLTADKRIVTTDYKPYFDWRAACEANHVATGADPLECSRISMQDTPNELLSVVAFRGAELVAQAPAYSSSAGIGGAVFVTAEKMSVPSLGTHTFVLACAKGPFDTILVSVVYAPGSKNRDTIMYVVLWIPLTFVGLGTLLVVHLVFLYPIRTYASAMEDITRLDLDAVDAKLTASSLYLRFDELHRLNDHFLTMNRSMAMFTAYVPKEVVRDMMIADTMGSRAMEVRQLTVMFADIESFTTICEGVDTADLAPVLDKYFETMSRILLSHACTIDKFIGDAIMGFWGAPLLHRYQAFSCCCACLHMQHAVESTLASCFQELGFELNVRIGCHMGYASVGNIGCAERMSYTALGDTVNIASRLEGMNKRYNTRLLMSQSIAFDSNVDNFVFRLLESVVLKGRTEPIQVFELVGISGRQIATPIVPTATNGTNCVRGSTSPATSPTYGTGMGNNFQIANGSLQAPNVFSSVQHDPVVVLDEGGGANEDGSESTMPSRASSSCLENAEAIHNGNDIRYPSVAPQQTSPIATSTRFAYSFSSSPVELRTTANNLRTTLLEDGAQYASLGISLDVVTRRIAACIELANHPPNGTSVHGNFVFKADFK